MKNTKKMLAEIALVFYSLTFLFGLANFIVSPDILRFLVAEGTALICLHVSKDVDKLERLDLFIDLQIIAFTSYGLFSIWPVRVVEGGRWQLSQLFITTYLAALIRNIIIAAIPDDDQ